MQIIRFRCCLLVTFDRLRSLTISTMCQINVCRRKYDAEKGCGAKFGCLWEFALGYSAHLRDCGHLFSEGVYTDQSPICIGLLHANMDLVSPNKSDSWHTQTLTIWTPETMARKYEWGKYYASLCNQFNFSFFGSCHLFIGTMTGKLLQLSPSVLLKNYLPNIIQ